MDSDQSEKLDRIHTDVRESKTRIEVIDERTKSLDARMDNLRGDINNNENDINELQDTVKRNTTIIGGVATAATAFLLWVADKLRLFA